VIIIIRKEHWQVDLSNTVDNQKGAFFKIIVDFI